MQIIENQGHFEPKAIAGFIRFLTHNRLAARFGDVFTLNESAIPHIERFLAEPADTA
jgi:hypothetical protein